MHSSPTPSGLGCCPFLVGGAVGFNLPFMVPPIACGVLCLGPVLLVSTLRHSSIEIICLSVVL